MSITLCITDAGRAALINVAHDGTNAVRIASVGVSPTAIVAAGDTAALPGEVKRITTVSGSAVAADVIHLVVRDESADTYTVRSFALYLADGTLFASYGQPTPIIEKSSAALLLLAVDATLADIAAEHISFGDANFLNPPATVDTAGVVELATDAEAAALTDALRALTPKSMAAIFTAANILSRLLGVDGAGSGLDADMLDGRQGSEFALLTGGTFTGGITFGAGTTFNGGMFRDPNFYLNLPSATTADISFDAGDVLRYDRTANTYSFLVDSMPAMAVGATGIKRAGNVVWDAANDGGGSGLDADLLDGQHGAWYADIAGRLGFTPLDSSIYTPANLLSKITTVDGAGSGLDADLLDGRQAAEFALLTGGTFTGGITFGAGTTFNAGIFRDSYFYLNLTNDTTADVSFDAGDVLRYNRTANTYSFLIGSTPAVAIGTAGITRGGNVVWDAANDGSGSGLDADFLDGQHGAWYTDVAGRLGFTPLNAATYTAANALAKLVTVDGAGSGLDADLLDGRNGAEYALLAGSTFTGAITGAAGLYRDANFYLNLVNATTADLSFDAGDVIRYDRMNNVYRHFIGSNEIFQVAGGYVNANAALLQQGNQVWHVGNDGSGSGLDADLLDGRHGAEFARVTAFSSAANGYRVHDDGFKECWGSTYIPQNQSIVIALPVAHTAWCVPTGSCSITQDEASIGVVQVSGNPPDSFIVRNRNPVGTTFFWHTRGV